MCWHWFTNMVQGWQARHNTGQGYTLQTLPTGRMQMPAGPDPITHTEMQYAQEFRAVLFNAQRALAHWKLRQCLTEPGWTAVGGVTG